MSIMPLPFEPAVLRDDHNQSTSEIVSRAERIEIVKLEKDNTCFKQCCFKNKQLGIKIVENIYFQIFITIFTICSLFMQDFRVIFINIDTDSVIDGVNIAFIIIFSVEVVLSLSVPGYACSFFFYLDILSTLSIIMDISMLTNLLYQSNSESSGIQLSVIIKNSKASRAAARTVRVMKIFRLARIVKLYKSATKAKELKEKKMKQQMNQKLLILKQQKQKQIEKDLENLASLNNINSILDSKKQMVPSDALIIRSDKETNVNKFSLIKSNRINNIQCQNNQKVENQIYDKKSIKSQDKPQQFVSKIAKRQSKISKLLSDNTMKKIILVILLLMFSVPVLDTQNYYQQTSNWDFLADFVSHALKNPYITLDKINQVISQNIIRNINSNQSSQTLILFKTPFNELYFYDSGLTNLQRINDLAISQKETNISQIMQIRQGSLTLKSSEDILNTISIICSSREYSTWDSWFSISKIVFICLGIIYLLHIFNDSITQLITEPIQKMLDDVRNNSNDLAIETDKQGKEKQNQNLANVNNFETTNVQISLNKISKMISNIFGIRGKQNIYRRIFEPSSVKANFLTKNKRSFCIIGICTIDKYNALTEILKEEIVQLNKQIAYYLHSSAYRYGSNGFVNHQGSYIMLFDCQSEQKYIKKKQKKQKSQKIEKKLVNPIKLSMKLKQSLKQIKLKQRYEAEQNSRKAQVNVLADFSIFSFVKTLVKVQKQSQFYKYRKDSRITAVLGQNFQVKLNFVLHCGMVEQGFMGSKFRMDYTYFGQAIQQAKQIANFCRQLSNTIVVTDSGYNLITGGMKRYLRILARFSRDSKQKSLYMVDLNLQNISQPKSILEKKFKKRLQQINLKRILNLQWLRPIQIDRYKASAFINSKKELREALRNVISEQFRRKFFLAYDFYCEGNLLEAKQMQAYGYSSLDELFTFNRDDFLSNRLYRLILSQTFPQPSNRLYI